MPRGIVVNANGKYKSNPQNKDVHTKAVQYLANVVNFNGEESISLAVCKLGYYITR